MTWSERFLLRLTVCKTDVAPFQLIFERQFLYCEKPGQRLCARDFHHNPHALAKASRLRRLMRLRGFVDSPFNKLMQR